MPEIKYDGYSEHPSFPYVDLNVSNAEKNLKKNIIYPDILARFTSQKVGVECKMILTLATRCDQEK